MKHKTIPIFVPHMGCPNDCSFCNQRKITGVTELTPKEADLRIMTALGTMPDNVDCVEIGFFGGSFTGIDIDLQKEFLTVAKKYKDSGKVHAIRLSTRPDYINNEILDMLKNYGVTTVELGAQSMNNRVLALNRRGHTSEDTIKASKLIKSKGINLGLQIMTGLYGDDNKTCLESLEKIVALSPDCVRIYPTLVLKGTYLDELYQNKKYTPQTLDEAILLVSELKQRLDMENISVIRIGLMASDNINPDADVIAGPYHPSMGELVQSELYYRQIADVIDSDSVIFVNPKDISAFVGNKKKNIEKIKELGYDVSFRNDENVKPGEFKILGKEQR